MDAMGSPNSVSAPAGATAADRAARSSGLPDHLLDLFRQALERERARLLGRVQGLKAAERALSEGQREVGSAGADVASELAEEAVLLGLEKADSRRLIEVEAALRRVDSGRYGLCERCGRPIAPERLEVLPWTGFCRQCAGWSGTGRLRPGSAR